MTYISIILILFFYITNIYIYTAIQFYNNFYNNLKLETLNIEFSTKLESTDVYIPQDRAQQIAGLNDTEMKNLHELVRVLAYRLRDLFSKSNLLLWDGKFEFAFTEEDEEGNRAFQLVDSIGPDELRLTYDGVQLSKECLRRPYRGSDWHSAISQSKSLAKERGVQNWKRICMEELGWDHATWVAQRERYMTLWHQHYYLPSA